MTENTIFVFTSDHGEMLGSQGEQRKQRPWAESIDVPFLIRWPGGGLVGGREVPALLDAPDLMPTLLILSGLAIPPTVEGKDFSDMLTGTVPADPDDAAVLRCVVPFAEFFDNGREYRGLRTRRYTYVRDLNGPWLLYDNETDPYQMSNLIGWPETADIQARLDTRLDRELAAQNDAFLPWEQHVAQWGYSVGADQAIPYTE